MRVLVTGVTGQLGYDVLKMLKIANIESIGTSRKNFDITDYENSYKYIFSYKPDVIIHCGAYTAVDKAEDEAKICRYVNVDGTRNIANICNNIGATLMYISTDYVFDGTKTGAYEVDDITNPLNVYGATKLEGEKIIQKVLQHYFIVRTSWAFGINGNNFVKTILKLSQKNKELNVVGNQYGSPTYTHDLAVILCDMIKTKKYGIYHATNEGVCSWAEFAEEIIKDAGLDVKINHVDATDYITKAKRPLNSQLSKSKLRNNGFPLLRDWREALQEYLSVLKGV